MGRTRARCRSHAEDRSGPAQGERLRMPKRSPTRAAASVPAQKLQCACRTWTRAGHAALSEVVRRAGDAGVGGDASIRGL